MKRYSIIYKRDRVKSDELPLFKLHKDYLAELNRKKRLLYYCHDSNENKILLGLLGVSVKEIKALIKEDPYIKCFYYERFDVNEWIEGNEESNYFECYKHN